MFALPHSIFRIKIFASVKRSFTEVFYDISSHKMTFCQQYNAIHRKGAEACDNETDLSIGLSLYIFSQDEMQMNS
jgi:hypothetical protein